MSAKMAQPVLSVGAGVGVDAHDPQFTGVFPGAFGFVLVLGIFHIAIPVVGLSRDSAGATVLSFGSECWTCGVVRPSHSSVGCQRSGHNPLKGRVSSPSLSSPDVSRGLRGVMDVYRDLSLFQKGKSGS